jgi:thiol:disulfide interchange protein DsbC
MKKILAPLTYTLASIFLTSSLVAKDLKNSVASISLDNKILDYNKKILSFNPEFELKNQTILKKEQIGNDKNWFAYTLDLFIVQKETNKEIRTPYFLFSNGEYITTTMINLNTNERYGDDILKSMKQKEQLEREKVRTDFENKFTLNQNYYTKDRLIAGNPNGKIKIAVFSDPLCVYCIKNVPAIINEIAKRDDMALYYFNFPLDSIHPTSQTVIRAIEASKKLGIKDGEAKVYKANMENFYDVYRTNDKQIALDSVNKILETKLTLADLDSIEINERIKSDIEIANEAKIEGTPSILFNGSFVNSREKLFEALKKK